MNHVPRQPLRFPPRVASRPELDTTLDRRRQQPPTVRQPSERRTFLRYRSRLVVPCRLTRNTGEGPWFATVRNISARGIGLISNRQFKAGMLLTIELPGKGQSYSQPKLLRVTHSLQQTNSQRWTWGGTFASPLTEEELRLMLG
jgi:hypothetical protein